MMPRRHWPAVLVLAVGIAACGGSGSATPSASPVASSPSQAGPAVAVPAAVQGTWTADVTGSSATPGTWTLTAGPDEITLTNPNPGSDPFPLHPIAFDGATFTLPADGECPDQASPTEGVYRWSIKDAKLVITLISDSCGDRSGVLVTAPWTRKP